MRETLLSGTFQVVLDRCGQLPGVGSHGAGRTRAPGSPEGTCPQTRRGDLSGDWGRTGSGRYRRPVPVRPIFTCWPAACPGVVRAVDHTIVHPLSASINQAPPPRAGGGNGAAPSPHIMPDRSPAADRARSTWAPVNDEVNDSRPSFITTTWVASQKLVEIEHRRDPVR